jgi:hypothetical protein
MKHIILLLAGCALSPAMRAELNTEVHRIGGSADDRASAVVPSSTGGFLIAGYTESTDGDIAGVHHGGRDAWIVRLGNEGQIIWQTLLGGSGDDIATGIIEMPAGEVIVCGHTWSSDGDFPLHQGPSLTADIFIAKLSAQGQVIWNHTLGSAYDDFANDVVSLTNNRIALGGTVQGTGSDVEEILGMKDIWLAQLDGNGNLLWEHTYGGALHDELHHIAAGPDGGVWLAGSSESLSGTEGDHEGVVIKVDGNGQWQWHTMLGSIAPHDHANMSSFEVLDDGRVRIGYTTTGTELDGVNCTPHGSVMIAHLDAEGEVTGNWCYGGSAPDYARSVIAEPGGLFWLLSDTRSTDGHVSSDGMLEDSGFNGWLLLCNQEGIILENVLLGGGGHDYTAGIARNADNRMIAVLNTFSDPEDAGEAGGIPTSDVMLVLLTRETVGIQDEAPDAGVLLFPNPASSVLTISITDPEDRDEKDGLHVRDVTGKLVFTVMVQERNAQVDVSYWPEGLYVVQGRNGKLIGRVAVVR